MRMSVAAVGQGKATDSKIEDGKFKDDEVSFTVTRERQQQGRVEVQREGDRHQVRSRPTSTARRTSRSSRPSGRRTRRRRTTAAAALTRTRPRLRSRSRGRRVSTLYAAQRNHDANAAFSRQPSSPDGGFCGSRGGLELVNCRMLVLSLRLEVRLSGSALENSPTPFSGRSNNAQPSRSWPRNIHLRPIAAPSGGLMAVQQRGQLQYMPRKAVMPAPVLQQVVRPGIVNALCVPDCGIPPSSSGDDVITAAATAANATKRWRRSQSAVRHRQRVT